MYEQIHEQIAVEAVFANSQIKIIQFTWQGRVYKVNEINLITKARRGRELVWLYYVSNDSGAYKLRFDTEAVQWWLEELTWETK